MGVITTTVLPAGLGQRWKMAFPDKWVQSWFTLPWYNYPGTALFPYMLQWWSYDTAIDPATFDFALLGHSMMDWFEDCVIPRVASTPAGGVQVPSLQNWVHGAWGTSGFVWTTAAIYARALCLPNTHNVIVRRYNSSGVSAGHSRVYIPGIPVGDADSYFLTEAAQLLWQTTINNMTAQVTIAGVTFTPCTVSYKTSAMYPINHCAVGQRLALIKRRGRTTTRSPFPGPKPPPP